MSTYLQLAFRRTSRDSHYVKYYGALYGEGAYTMLRSNHAWPDGKEYVEVKACNQVFLFAETEARIALYKEMRCINTSPVMKFDEGPRQCSLEKDHKGFHSAKTSAGHYVDPLVDYIVNWDDEGNWVIK